MPEDKGQATSLWLTRTRPHQIWHSLRRSALPSIRSLGVDSPVDEIEVGPVVGAVFGGLPASGDRVPVVAEGCWEALGERLALSPELPLPVADAHLVDAADAAHVGVQLEVRPVGRIASDDGEAVGRLGKLSRPTLDQ